MKRIVLILCVLSLGIATTGCDEYDYTGLPKSLLVVECDLEFDAKGGAGKIVTVSDRGSIKAKSNKEEWCTVTVSGMQVNVTVIANPNIVNRTALITITSGTETTFVPVTQASTLFVIDELVFHSSWQGQTFETGYRSESVVTTSTTDAWITPTVNAADSKIVIVVAENPLGTPRSGSLKVVSGGVTQVIKITQDLQVISYAKLLGKWTMSSTKTTGVANPDEEITFTQKTAGSVFTTTPWQGGATYEISYNKNTGALTLAMGQFAYAYNENTLKLAGWDNSKGYITINQAISVTGTWNLDSDNPVYTFADNGSWAGYVVRGICLGAVNPAGDLTGNLYNALFNVKLTKKN